MIIVHSHKLHYIVVLQSTEKNAFIAELALNNMTLLNAYVFLSVTSNQDVMELLCDTWNTIYLNEVTEPYEPDPFCSPATALKNGTW